LLASLKLPTACARPQHIPIPPLQDMAPFEGLLVESGNHASWLMPQHASCHIPRPHTATSYLIMLRHFHAYYRGALPHASYLHHASGAVFMPHQSRTSCLMHRHALTLAFLRYKVHYPPPRVPAWATSLASSISVHHAPCTMHNAPCTVLCTMHHYTLRSPCTSVHHSTALHLPWYVRHTDGLQHQTACPCV
jgi:hypothetical protein